MKTKGDLLNEDVVVENANTVEKLAQLAIKTEWPVYVLQMVYVECNIPWK